MIGVAWAILDPSEGVPSNFMGDIFALLAAIFWAAIGLGVRVTSAREASPQGQLMAQLLISAAILLGASLFFGPILRDPGPKILFGMVFQVVVIATFGYLFWLWLLTVYPAASVASFSFLAPIFGVLFGWALLDEILTVGMFGGLALVVVGLVLINRRSPG